MSTNPERIRKACFNLLQPYIIGEDSPYLSEDQRELSKLTLEKRAAWMAEWLYLANEYGRPGKRIRPVVRKRRMTR